MHSSWDVLLNALAQSIVTSQRDDKWEDYRFLCTYINVCAFPHILYACIPRTASLENSVTQEYSLVLGELDSFPSNCLWLSM